jgi:hypothetical protein
MGNYRLAKVFAQKSYDADFTELIDINVADPISALTLNYQGYNSGSTASTAHWAKGLTSIEIVDGSDVLFSLNGMELYALQHIAGKQRLADWIHYLGSNYFSLNLRILFGRWLYDPDLALDPKKFRNLQLKVVSDMDAGGVAPSANKLTVIAHCFDQKTISPAGFIQSKRIKEYTMGSASHEYTGLPTDLKIRRLMIKALLAGKEPNQVMQSMKLSEDNDKRVILDLDMDEVGWMFPEENQLYVEGFMAGGSTSHTHYHCTPTSKVTGNVNSWAEDAVGYNSFYDGDGGYMSTDGSAAGNVVINCQGYYPNGVISLPMGDEYDPADWYDPSGVLNLRLDLLSCAAGSTYAAQILLQQFRPY